MKMPSRSGVHRKRQAGVTGNYEHLPRWSGKLSNVCRMALPEKDETIGLRKKTTHEVNTA